MARFLICALTLSALVACDDGGGVEPSPPIVIVDEDAAPDMAPIADMAVVDAAPAGDAMAPDMGVEPGVEGPPGSACNCDDNCAAVDGQAGICVVGVCMVEPSEACSGGEVNGCPTGFQCWSMEGGTGPFCWPDCDAIDDCAGACDGDGSCAPAEGTACDAMCSAHCGGNAPTGDIGGACDDDGDCGGATCYGAEGWVNGYCLDFECAEAGAECGNGGVCVSGISEGGNVCMGACAGAEDCRPGYQCREGEDGSFCFAGCAGDDACPDGFVCGADEVCVVDFRCGPSRPSSGECPAGEICTGGECVVFECVADGMLEPNESQAAAAVVDATVEGLQICADDHDWYHFTPNGEGMIHTVGHTAEFASGNLDITLVTADGDVHEQGWLLPEGYHPEAGRGPMNFEAVSLVGHPDAAQFSAHVFPSGSAVNNYDLRVTQTPYVDGPDCEGAGYTKHQCQGITDDGRLDVSEYIVFPAGHAADPYIGDGVFFDSGLTNSNTPGYVPSSARWARREMVMAIRHAIHVVQETYPGTTPLGIGEISMIDGSTPNGHPNGTHYYGANVDLAYYIREDAQRQWGNITYRPICSDKPNLRDWSDVDTDGSRGAFGECIPGSEDTHIVDIPRTALLFATMCATGRVRVFGVDTSIAAQLKTEYRRLLDEEIITRDAYNACMRSQASADDDGSWVWHFNHSHVSFCAQDCPGQKSGAVETLRPTVDVIRGVSVEHQHGLHRLDHTPAVFPREVEGR